MKKNVKGLLTHHVLKDVETESQGLGEWLGKLFGIKFLLVKFVELKSVFFFGEQYFFSSTWFGKGHFIGPVYKTNLVRTKSLSDHGPDQIWLCKRYLSVPKSGPKWDLLMCKDHGPIEFDPVPNLDM